MSNSVDPDETAHYEPSHLDLRCLQKPIIIAYGNERINKANTSFQLMSKRVITKSSTHLCFHYILWGNVGVKVGTHYIDMLT